MLLLRRPRPHIHDERLDASLPRELLAQRPTLLFPSIHRSEQNVPCLTVHPLGNPGARSDVGGKPRTLVPTDPPRMGAALRALASRGAAVGLAATFEATHHGPELALPSFFVEIGYGTLSEPPPEAVRILAEEVPRIEVEAGDRVAMAVGGGHYAPHFTDLSHPTTLGVRPHPLAARADGAGCGYRGRRPPGDPRGGGHRLCPSPGRGPRSAATARPTASGRGRAGARRTVGPGSQSRRSGFFWNMIAPEPVDRLAQPDRLGRGDARGPLGEHQALDDLAEQGALVDLGVSREELFLLRRDGDVLSEHPGNADIARRPNAHDRGNGLPVYVRIPAHEFFPGPRAAPAVPPRAPGPRTGGG